MLPPLPWRISWNYVPVLSRSSLEIIYVYGQSIWNTIKTVQHHFHAHKNLNFSFSCSSSYDDSQNINKFCNLLKYQLNWFIYLFNHCNCSTYTVTTVVSRWIQTWQIIQHFSTSTAECHWDAMMVMRAWYRHFKSRVTMVLTRSRSRDRLVSVRAFLVFRQQIVKTHHLFRILRPCFPIPK